MAAENSDSYRETSRLARPVQRFTDDDPRTFCCPRCLDSVEPLGAPFVTSTLLDGCLADLLEGGIPVRGYECEQCDLVLPVDPRRDDLDDGPGWQTVWTAFRDGSSRPVLVPTREVER